MEAKDCFTITLTWCAKHNNWWVTNCPDCMVDANEESIKREGRREVVDELAHSKVYFPGTQETKEIYWLVDDSKLKEWGKYD